MGVRAAGGDTTTAVATGVAGSIAGLHGTLVLQANGSYTYQSLANNIAANTTDVFVYTVRNGDGDLSTTTLTINLTEAGLVAAADNDALVNEAALDLVQDGADLSPGLVTGSLPGSTAETDATNQLNASGGFGTLTYALVSPAAGSYGTIQINANGSYTYTLTRPYDTTPDANNNTNIEDNRDSFTYSVTDANGKHDHQHDHGRHRRRHSDGDVRYEQRERGCVAERSRGGGRSGERRGRCRRLHRRRWGCGRARRGRRHDDGCGDRCLGQHRGPAWHADPAGERQLHLSVAGEQHRGEHDGRVRVHGARR